MPFDELGGVSTHVHMLSEGLQALGETVHIVDEWPPWIYRIPLVRLPCVLLDKASRQLSLRWELAARHLYYLADYGSYVTLPCGFLLSLLQLLENFFR